MLSPRVYEWLQLAAALMEGTSTYCFLHIHVVGSSAKAVLEQLAAGMPLRVCLFDGYDGCLTCFQAMGESDSQEASSPQTRTEPRGCRNQRAAMIRGAFVRLRPFIEAEREFVQLQDRGSRDKGCNTTGKLAML